VPSLLLWETQMLIIFGFIKSTHKSAVISSWTYAAVFDVEECKLSCSGSMIYYCYYYYYRYSALGLLWAETRAQSGDWCGSGMLHPGQILRGSLPLLSPGLILPSSKYMTEESNSFTKLILNLSFFFPSHYPLYPEVPQKST
jgi:hypothetical protein